MFRIFSDNFLIVVALSFLAWLWYLKRNPAVTANNTVPYWYTAAGGGVPKSFDYSSQSNYLNDQMDGHN